MKRHRLKMRTWLTTAITMATPPRARLGRMGHERR